MNVIQGEGALGTSLYVREVVDQHSISSAASWGSHKIQLRGKAGGRNAQITRMG